ncbi:MAG: TIGR01459 family HAD-type hydrolase [Rhodospirillum sp.]|nr:TIGR01459 family HAD-type hydrolase [Rhodospirillum sp.]MCF8489986.1 TIGR01459 family HAD-type hydrolase [Rhodospirillum sp.]MCF8501520.1 TIGR01459 family HAD-type hydrolase [Rhodospirillum sp.]
MTDAAQAPLHLDGLSQIARNYDGFILDLWGVIHDGVSAYPGASDTLLALKRMGKRTVLLSNAPRLGRSVSDLMTTMGIDRDLYDAIMTSGDAVNLELLGRKDPFFADLGDTCYMIGPDRDLNVLDGTGVTHVRDPKQASFALCSGIRDFSHGIEVYRPELEACAAEHLPMVCSNPDKEVMRDGERVLCAGALAAVYREKLGQTVVFRGKPDPAIYRLAMGKLGLPEGARIAAVGDGLQTDMPGAKAAGVDGIFVTGGLNAGPLGVAHGEKADPKAIDALLAAHDATPVATIPGFLW